MKRIISVIAGLVLAIAFTGCGVGNYTTVSGKADEALLSFSSPVASYALDVEIDGQHYSVQCVRNSNFKTNRNIKATSRNTITLAPGTHTVVATAAGKQVYSGKIFVSAQDHKVIEI